VVTRDRNLPKLYALSLHHPSSFQHRVMLSFFRTRTSNAVRALGHVRRYSTPIEASPQTGETSSAPGALRPHLNIPVNPNHGLYAFFRKREKDGKVIYDHLEDDSGVRDVFGESHIACHPSYRISLTWARQQAELGVQQSSGEKASGIFTPCGTFS
jgi:hypothetical protein